jgi:nucleotide exchange factor SIL1
MDIYSGLKQARLNIPMEGEEDNSNIATEQAMVIVDQPEQDVAEEKVEPVALRDKSGKKPPAYKAAGKILPPREEDGGVSDGEEFQRAVAILESDQVNNYAVSVTALTVLLDLSHDIYYGVELMKNSAVIQQLVFCLDGDLSDVSTSASRRRLAAGVIANSIQNNPTALEEAQKSWRSYLPYPHSASSSSALQEYAADQEFLSRILLALRSESDPGAAKAKINALSGLVKSPELRDVVLHLEGLETPLGLFARVGEEWEVVRKKVAEFVTDNFLDEDMGAEIGKWPTKQQRMDDACVFKAPGANGMSPAVGDECWVYHVMNYVLEKEEAKEDDGWSKQFLQMLRGETEKLGMFVHDEL